MKIRSGQSIVISLVLILVILGGLAVPSASPQRKLVLAFVPGLDSQSILESGGRIGRMLEIATGFVIETVVPTSYAATIEALCAGRVDVAFLAPFAYTLARERCAADVRLVSVRGGKPFHRSQILFRSDLVITSLKELKGKRFAFVDPASTSGYLFPAAMIKKATGEDPSRFFSQMVFAGGHDKVVIAIYQGRVDAGATFADELDARRRVVAVLPDVMERVKVLTYSEPIPNDTLAFRNDLPEETKTRISRAILRISETQPGKEALTDLFRIDGFTDLRGLREQYKLPVHSWDQYFEPIRQTARLLGIDLEVLIAPR